MVRAQQMIVRCQSTLRTLFSRPPGVVVTSASMSGAVLTPVAVLAAVLGVWRFGADPGWTSGFFIASGLFSRYQLWFAVAICAQAFAFVLNRWVASRNTAVPALTP